MFDLVTLHPHFVTPNHRLEAIILAKALSDIRPKLQPDPSLARTSSVLWLRICPQHLHHQPALARLPLPMPVQLPNIVQARLVVAEQAAMQGEILPANQGRERQG
jgi:hypothetical protein